MRLAPALLAALLLTAPGSGGRDGRAAEGGPVRLADLADASRWRAAPAEGVALSLRSEPDPAVGPALRMDFDFQGRAGWAAARLPLAVELPANWELRFRLRGEAPVNHLEVKLIDPSGENVWWAVRRDFEFPREWTPLRVKKRQVRFAWGPARGRELARLSALELVVTAGAGGRGTVWFADLELVPLPVAPLAPGPGRATASAELPGHEAGRALDGDGTTAWRAPARGARWTVDFGAPRELGGLTLRWEEGRQPRRFAVEASDDGAAFRPLRRVERAGGGRNDLFLPETETRWLRLLVDPGAGEIGLAELELRPLAFGEGKNAFFGALGREAPRGTYPRAFAGEQLYWTVVGVDGAAEEALVSEDGAVEPGERAPSLEPFVHLDGRLFGWAEVAASQRLADGDLPIPTVEWSLPGLSMAVTALAYPEAPSHRPRPAGPSGVRSGVGTGFDGATEGGDVSEVSPGSRLALRYRLANPGPGPREGTLFVAARPFQVNPPSQFLNLEGGAARLARARCQGPALDLDGRRLVASPPPAACGAAAFDEGPITSWLRKGRVPEAPEVADDFGHASAALAWPFRLAPGEARDVMLAVPLDAGSQEPPDQPSSTMPVGRAMGRIGASPALESLTPAALAALEAAGSAAWRERLGRVEIVVPAAAEPLVSTLRSGLAAILIHRDGPALQPGSRSYARSWIRDGALTSSALLRLGHAPVARDFARWYASFLYPDGKVPCCVDRRGADPVPEHDSHGQWLHLVWEVFRHTGDREFALGLFPAVERTVAHLEDLRAARRTAEYRHPEKLHFWGLLPPSISHEGYSERPMHSYWDDAFAYRGYTDAVALARELGRADLAARWAASRDEFRADLLASLRRAGRRHGLGYLPGCAELGDFDPASSTVLLEPGGLGGDLPREAVEATFERYYREFAARRDGRRSWEALTPYELRIVGAFVRLGWRERAGELLDFFLAQRRPPAWNGWPEVVGRLPREPRFVGDLPHGWVASDFARSLLDLFAYERREEGALVLAAGLPRAWLAGGEEVGVRALRTPWGEISYALRLRGGRLVARIEALAKKPPGGVLLALPLSPATARIAVDGVAWPPGAREIRLGALPATVEVEAPW